MKEFRVSPPPSDHSRPADHRDASASSLGAVPLDALLHDAGRCCVEAYFAP
jgi:hypothetical protein